MYREGDGVEVNKAEAFKWLKLAASHAESPGDIRFDVGTHDISPGTALTMTSHSMTNMH